MRLITPRVSGSHFHDQEGPDDLVRRGSRRRHPLWPLLGPPMDETLFKIAERVRNFTVVYLMDTTEVPDFNVMYELYDAVTVMFFVRNKHILVDLGTITRSTGPSTPRRSSSTSSRVSKPRCPTLDSRQSRIETDSRLSTVVHAKVGASSSPRRITPPSTCTEDPTAFIVALYTRRSCSLSLAACDFFVRRSLVNRRDWLYIAPPVTGRIGLRYDRSTMSATKKGRVTSKALKRKKHRKESFNSYIFKVLKSIHGAQVGISSKAMSIMNSFVNDIFERMADEAAKLAQYKHRSTVTAREMQTAVRLLLPGELCNHSLAEAAKSVARYRNSSGNTTA
uniref:Histone domain-containing protein n=1 Tax=Steinernema glaseri TaxID=37863 RepID=A0A1I8ABC8_9BILA